MIPSVKDHQEALHSNENSIEEKNSIEERNSEEGKMDSYQKLIQNNIAINLTVTLKMRSEFQIYQK